MNFSFYNYYDVFGLIFHIFSDKYDQIENELIEEFRIAHREGDKRKMKRCASVLSNFKVRRYFYRLELQ